MEPNRYERRHGLNKHGLPKKKGDLNRTSTHKLRTNDGVRESKTKVGVK
jgi:hypothetical protein